MLYLTRRHLLGLVAAAAVSLCVLSPFAQAEDKGPLVFAAASLKDALDRINANWQKESGKQAVISYAASSTLAKQIDEERDAIAVLRAEWSLLNRPERIERLAQKYLKLAPAKPVQLVTVDTVTERDFDRTRLEAAVPVAAPTSNSNCARARPISVVASCPTRVASVRSASA